MCRSEGIPLILETVACPNASASKCWKCIKRWTARSPPFGHVLFVSSMEAETLLAAAPPYEQPVTPDFCPFQKGNLCTAREPRPLSCRVYYCDPNYQEKSGEITEKYLRRLKQLADAEGVPWHYAPLHHFLNGGA
jgi:Fe-S-cluster containining protein